MGIVYRQTYDMYVRPNTSDDFICDEAESYSGLFINSKPYDVLMDIGANIGSVTRLANDIQPDMTIVSYEPDQDNYDLLLLNTNDLESKRFNPLNFALGTGQKEVNFYLEKGSFKAKHSTLNREFKHGYIKTKVNQLDFKNELIKHNATLLKIDIEGGEYNLNLKNLPKQIKGIAIEFHLINDDHELMLSLYRTLKEQFPFQVGDIPEDDIFYFREVFKEPDSAFMCIFLRNEE